MDHFNLLTRVASLNKGKRLKQATSKQKLEEKIKQKNLLHQIDKEIDFFHTKNHSIDQEIDDEIVEDEITEENVPKSIKSIEDGKKFRKLYKSNVTGNDLPLPIGSFHDLTERFQLDSKLLSNLIQSNFTEPTPIQCESIPIALNNRDLIACAPTGSGKTLAYLIPLVQMIKPCENITGLIVSPTNELAVQIFENLEILCKGKKLKIAILSRSLATKLSNNIINSNKYDIIVSTPLRLIDLINQNFINLSNLEYLILDEADKLFDQNFIQQTDDILSHCKNPLIKKLMFSATIPSNIEEIAHSIMKDPIRIIIGSKEAASNTIEQKLEFTGNEDGKLIAIRQLLLNGEFKPPIIIFLQSIHRAKALFHELLYDKLNVDVIHAERTPKQREKVIERFKSGDIWVLITTDVISRGVDFHGVNMVINYDVPQSAQAYVHRIGRTGRNGKVGKAITFFTKEDEQSVKPIVNVMVQSGCQDGIPSWMLNVSKLSKNQKKNIKNHEMKRREISTVPKIVKHKRKQRQEMIEASKRRKESTKEPIT